MKRFPLAVTLFSTSLVALAVSESVHAQEKYFSVRAGAAFSDNIRRSANNEEEETIPLLDVVTRLEHTGRTVQASLNTNLGYRTYQDTNLDDEVLGGASANLVLMPAPETFHWTVSNSFGTTQSNPFTANSPLDRENINNFATGPDFFLNFGRRTRLGINGRWQTYDFEVSETDNETIGGTVSLTRTLTPNRSVSLNVSGREVDFDNPLNSDLELQTAAIGFNSEVSNGSLSVQIGGNQVESDDGLIDGDGLFANVGFRRQVTARTSFSISYDQRLSTAGDIFQLFQNAGGREFGNTRNVAGVAEPFENRRLNFGLEMLRGSSTYFLGANIQTQEYVETNGLDRDRYTLSGGWNHQFGFGWSFSADAALERQEYDITSRTDDWLRFGLALSKDLSRAFDIAVRFESTYRDSNNNAVDIDENRISVTVGYTYDRTR